ncbi:MAG: rubredoxin [Angelakisella sp.]
MTKYVCTVCGFVYDEAVGCPEAGVAPGTPWSEVPEDFVCPLCGVDKTMKIKEGIYSVGAQNPALRVFDIVMSTDYGTSYNSYLVRGSEKTALIDVCHKSFYKQYLENIKEVCSPADIDILVLNHNEPDHTGALAQLLGELGEVTIYTTTAGAIYIKAITNRTDLNIIAVKDGDKIDLGGKTLKFVPAPFLHWPDSMFTAVPEDKLVFTCDFLGAHYCEPYVLDKNITYPDKYKDALKGYYDAIFGPFKKYVLMGLDKLNKLDFDMVLPSHGPVLTQGERGQLDYVMDCYRKWSAPVVRKNKLVPIFYTSAYGNTKAIAEKVAEGVRSTVEAVDVKTYDIIKHSMAEQAGLLNSCDGFAIGTPTINRDAVPPVWQLLSGFDAVNSTHRPCVVFGSYGWSGEGVPNVCARLISLKCTLVAEGLKVTFVPTEDDLTQAFELGVSLGNSL